MSSQYVVTQTMNFIASEIPSENAFDLTGEYDYFQNFFEDNGITGDWLGVQFIGQEEIPIDIGATNSKGKYRELGLILLHICAKSQIGLAGVIRPRAETIKNAFRGQRIGDMIIESVSPPNFEAGATLDIEGNYSSAVMQVRYRRDNNL
jgi:hypothetical protein